MVANGEKNGSEAVGEGVWAWFKKNFERHTFFLVFWFLVVFIAVVQFLHYGVALAHIYATHPEGVGFGKALSLAAGDISKLHTGEIENSGLRSFASAMRWVSQWSWMIFAGYLVSVVTMFIGGVIDQRYARPPEEGKEHKTILSALKAYFKYKVRSETTSLALFALAAGVLISLAIFSVYEATTLVHYNGQGIFRVGSYEPRIDAWTGENYNVCRLLSAEVAQFLFGISANSVSGGTICCYLGFLIFFGLVMLGLSLKIGITIYNEVLDLHILRDEDAQKGAESLHLKLVGFVKKKAVTEGQSADISQTHENEAILWGVLAGGAATTAETLRNQVKSLAGVVEMASKLIDELSVSAANAAKAAEEKAARQTNGTQTQSDTEGKGSEDNPSKDDLRAGFIAQGRDLHKKLSEDLGAFKLPIDDKLIGEIKEQLKPRLMQRLVLWQQIVDDLLGEKLKDVQAALGRLGAVLIPATEGKDDHKESVTDEVWCKNFAAICEELKSTTEVVRGVTKDKVVGRIESEEKECNDRKTYCSDANDRQKDVHKSLEEGFKTAEIFKNAVGLAVKGNFEKNFLFKKGVFEVEKAKGKSGNSEVKSGKNSDEDFYGMYIAAGRYDACYKFVDVKKSGNKSSDDGGKGTEKSNRNTLWFFIFILLALNNIIISPEVGSDIAGNAYVMSAMQSWLFVVLSLAAFMFPLGFIITWPFRLLQRCLDHLIPPNFELKRVEKTDETTKKTYIEEYIVQKSSNNNIVTRAFVSIGAAIIAVVSIVLLLWWVCKLFVPPIIAEPPPPPPLPPSQPARAMDLTSAKIMCPIAGSAINEGKTTWVFANQETLESRGLKVADCRIAAEVFSKINYLVVIGTASQEDTNNDEAKRAGSRAMTLADMVWASAPKDWKGRVYILNLGKHYYDTAVPYVAADTEHVRSAPQRRLAVLMGNDTDRKTDLDVRIRTLLDKHFGGADAVIDAGQYMQAECSIGRYENGGRSTTLQAPCTFQNVHYAKGTEPEIPQ